VTQIAARYQVRFTQDGSLTGQYNTLSEAIIMAGIGDHMKYVWDRVEGKCVWQKRASVRFGMEGVQK